MNTKIIAAALLTGFASSDPTWKDCDPVADKELGPFGPM